jgi:predicted DsbA family dithiol-disulfide isomerase
MTDDAPVPSVVVDLISDVVCPWCYIGKRKLEAALAELRSSEAGTGVAVRWHPFQLNPDIPREGIPRAAYLEAKFGGRARAGEIYARVKQAGAEVGIPFDFDRIIRQPNTLDAHRLVAWAQKRGDPRARDDLVERLFRAYFIDGRDIGDRDELARIAREAGFPFEEAQAMLASDKESSEVLAEDREAREVGVGGVPFFIFNGRTAVSGAHEPDTLLQALDASRTQA